MKLRRKAKVQKMTLYSDLAVYRNSHRNMLGHSVVDAGQGANFWLRIISGLQTRGVENIFVPCVDGLSRLSCVIHAVFPETVVQNSLHFLDLHQNLSFSREKFSLTQGYVEVPSTVPIVMRVI